MKKKVMGIIAVVSIAAVAGYNVYTSQNDNVKLSDLVLSNVEALANPGESGQPDVSNCIKDNDQSCLALHPTDPSQDKVRPQAIWP